MKVEKIQKPFAVIEGIEVFKDGTIKWKENYTGKSEVECITQPRQLKDEYHLLNIVFEEACSNPGAYLKAWFLAHRMIGTKSVTLKTDFEGDKEYGRY